jgi:hypothetical protein
MSMIVADRSRHITLKQCPIKPGSSVSSFMREVVDDGVPVASAARNVRAFRIARAGF